MMGCNMNKKVDGESFDNTSISSECLSLLEKLKPPFENTDEYLNRLIHIQEKYNQQKGKEFINMVFQDTFLSCTKKYLENYQSNKKKEHMVESTKSQIKQSIKELFDSNDDTILTLLMLVDESVSLLFQTDFYKILSQYPDHNFEDTS
jgi:biotin-(acetyl-CoA carboxylase) ligase